MGRSTIGNTVDSIAKWLLKFRIISKPARYLSNSKLAWSIVSRTDRIRTKRLETRIKNEKLPDHISIIMDCLLYTSPSPRDATLSRMPSSA